MLGNLILGLLSLLLGASPFLVRIRSLNEQFLLSTSNKLTGPMQYFTLVLGSIGLIICFYNLFVKKKLGALHIVIGILFVFVSFFFNQETLPRPESGAFLGGDLFFAFLIGIIMAATGAAVEYLT